MLALYETTIITSKIYLLLHKTTFYNEYIVQTNCHTSVHVVCGSHFCTINWIGYLVQNMLYLFPRAQIFLF